MASEPFAAFGKSFSTLEPNSADQYVSEIVDGAYIRWEKLTLNHENRLVMKCGTVDKEMITSLYGQTGWVIASLYIQAFSFLIVSAESSGRVS
jgi:hypothetical protein